MSDTEDDEPPAVAPTAAVATPSAIAELPASFRPAALEGLDLDDLMQVPRAPALVPLCALSLLAPRVPDQRGPRSRAGVQPRHLGAGAERP